jgi:hypothetical protein
METEIMADRRQREGEETDVDLFPLLSVGWEKKQFCDGAAFAQGEEQSLSVS